MNLPRYGVCDALPHPHPCLRTCIRFIHFSLGPSLKNIGCAHTHLGPALPTLRSHIYWCSKLRNETWWAPSKSYKTSWPNRKETLIISVKLQPNVINSKVGVISVRNRISRLKKLCIIKPIFCRPTNTINAWRIRPRVPFKLYIVYMYSDAHNKSHIEFKTVLRVFKWSKLSQ